MGEEPLSSASEALDRIEQFGQVADFKLSKTQRKMLVKNMDEHLKDELQQKIGIAEVKKVKYFRVWLTAKKCKLA